MKSVGVHKQGGFVEARTPDVRPAPARPQVGRLSAPRHHSTHAGSARRSGLIANLFILSVAALLTYGYLHRAEENFVPYEGYGYWLGVTGGVMLLLQLAYSAVKRMKSARRLAASRKIFHAHVFLGLLAPAAILHHSNFSLGATNSNVALATMLTVVVSGLIGRFVYRRVHNGFTGARENVTDLLDHATALLADIETDIGGSQGHIALHLTRFATQTLTQRNLLVSQLYAHIGTAFRIRWARVSLARKLKRVVEENASRYGWTRHEQQAHRKLAQLHVREYLEAVGKASRLAFWERFFACWHVFHVPLFYLLLFSGITHVVAVHWY